jgi:LmbE family N-acetylglucosaminyl deacetylase
VSVVFFHAHPDDEAIFTGGTMARLAAGGDRVVLVVATGGELGAPTASVDAGVDLGAWREEETHRAAATLGVARVAFLGYRDSGVAGDAANRAPGAFATADPDEATGLLATILGEERATALVVYDEGGIYGHPDHVQVHVVGHEAARRAAVPTLYEATVDREYLHFVETHLVVEARGWAGELGLAASGIGVPTVAVTTTVDVGGVLDVKRAAMACHASQIPETASALQLRPEAFAAVYGYEWYVRHGPPGPLDALA